MPITNSQSKTEVLGLENKTGQNDIFMYAWLIVALVPLLMILFSYMLGVWHWGLMDDLTILNSGKSFVERFTVYFEGLCRWGVFRPSFAAHSAAVYTIFDQAPKQFYIFKLFEIILMLAIWGIAAFRLTKQKIAIVLLPAITLSFHYFYDMFFYLSSHEFIGLFFIGVALHFFLNNFDGLLNINLLAQPERTFGDFSWRWWILCVFFLLCAFGVKETFISCGIAFGIFYLYLGCKHIKNSKINPFLISGFLTICITVCYAFLVKKYIQTGYTSSYAFGNLPKAISNIHAWANKDFLNHSPWILGAFFIYYLACKKDKFISHDFPTGVKLGVLVGILLYTGFLLILLPWNAVCYYVGPLGLFFAFIITVFISTLMQKLNIKSHIAILILALVLNLFVCQYALMRESTYQNDTSNLMNSIKSNFFKLVQKDRNYSVFCNAMEASNAIPGFIKRKWGLSMQSFRWSLDPNEDFGGKKCDFYLYSPRFDCIDLNKLNDWESVFLSKNWILYKRPSTIIEGK